MKCLFGAESCSLSDIARERDASDPLHDQVKSVLRDMIEVIDLHDVGVVQCRQRAYLSIETFDQFFLTRDVWVEDFHRKGFVNACMFNPVDGRKGTNTEPFNQSVFVDHRVKQWIFVACV